MYRITLKHTVPFKVSSQPFKEFKSSFNVLNQPLVQYFGG